MGAGAYVPWLLLVTCCEVMNTELNVEELNRKNFRYCLEAMSRPGLPFTIEPLADSAILAMASLLLFSEVGFFQKIVTDWTMIKALTGAEETSVDHADYLFLDCADSALLDEVKCGDQQNPEFSATLIYNCPNVEKYTPVVLRGPGINGTNETSLPVSPEFLHDLARKNKYFPLGVDLFFLLPGGSLIGLPRTTQVELQ